MEEPRKIKLFIDKRENGILQPDGTYGSKNNKDFYISLALFKTSKITDDYIDISLDSARATIERQLINPFFIELGFFETINTVGESTDTSGQTQSIHGKSQRFDIDINS